MVKAIAHEELSCLTSGETTGQQTRNAKLRAFLAFNFRFTMHHYNNIYIQMLTMEPSEIPEPDTDKQEFNVVSMMLCQSCSCSFGSCFFVVLISTLSS
jgi:hypothetical protein